MMTPYPYTLVASTLAGSGPPDNAIGVDGATYLDIASGLVYGPKTAGVWPTTPVGDVGGAFAFYNG